MRKLSFLCVWGWLLSISTLGQTFSGTTNGNDWNTASNWSTNPTVPSGTGTDVTIASDAVVKSPNSDLIGNVSLNNNTALTINSGGTLTLGSSALLSSGTSKSLTYSNSGTLTVAGTLYIYGDLVVNNTLTLNITGTMIVYGNVVLKNGGTLAVSGSGNLQVGGNFTGGNGSQISTSGSGTIAVTGSLSLGGGSSSISGAAGSITVGGSCSCTGCAGGTCGNTVLPIELLSFSAMVSGEIVALNWVTTSELNFDYFSLQRSGDGKLFYEIAQVKGHGTTNDLHAYSYEDTNPIIGRSYYSLTSIDIDGYQETFKIVAVEYQAEKKFHVVPNPSDGSTIGLSFNFDTASDAVIIIHDNLGKLLGTFRLGGLSSITLASKLSAGIYLATYASSNLTKTERFMVK